MTMTKLSPEERAEQRRRQKEVADSLKAFGAMDAIFAKIDAGEALGGEAGLLKGMLKAVLERGLDAELTEHVGYQRGDAISTSISCPPVLAPQLDQLPLLRAGHPLSAAGVDLVLAHPAAQAGLADPEIPAT